MASCTVLLQIIAAAGSARNGGSPPGCGPIAGNLCSRADRRLFQMIETFTILLVLTALLAYVNHRFIGLPPTIGVMGAALILSLLLALSLPAGDGCPCPHPPTPV